jgi:ABC-2 type transport system permease protein
MIRAIVGNELRAAWRDGRVRGGAVAFLVLGVVAFASAAARFESLAAERAAAQAVIAEQWREQGEKNPHSAAHYGIYAFKPVTPLAFFDTGVSAYEGVAIWLEAHKRNFAQGRPADDATGLARFGELTLGFVMQVLLPLAIVLVAYPAFAAERENGTLRQVLSTGASPAQLFSGKFLGLGLASFLLVAPLLALALAGLALASGGAYLAHAALLVLIYLLYGALFLALTLVVSARVRTAQGALLVMISIWALTCFVVPRLAADVGRVLHPAPLAFELQRAIDADLAAGIDGVSPAARIAQRREQLFRLYKVEREEDLPINFQGIAFGIQDEVGDAVYDKHFGALYTAIDAQIDVLEAASLLSPRAAVSLLSQEISGTSVRSQRAFADAAERFRRSLMVALNRDITFNAPPGAKNYRAGPELWQSTGEFRYPQPALRAALAGTGPAWTALVLWCVALAALSVLTCRRLQVLAS